MCETHQPLLEKLIGALFCNGEGLGLRLLSLCLRSLSLCLGCRRLFRLSLLLCLLLCRPSLLL